MLIRGIQIGIVVFWLATTFFLVRSTWFPDESRMNRVEVQEIVDLFFNWKEGSDLVIVSDGRRIGDMRLSATDPEKMEDPGLREISTTGTLRLGEFPETHEFFWKKGIIQFDEEFQPHFIDLGVRLPRQNVQIDFQFQKEPANVKLSVIQEGKTLFYFDNDPALLASMTPAGVPGAGVELPSVAEVSKWAPQLEGRYGNVSFGDRRLQVFMLLIKFGEETKIKIYFQDTGEILKVDTGIGVEAMPDVLVPTTIDA